MKLHLKCGNRNISGFVNVDGSLSARSDVVDDPERLRSFQDGSADLIYAPNVLETMTRADAREALRRWLAVLRPGGTVRVAVPDWGTLAELYCDQGVPLDSIVPFALGRGNRSAFDFCSLKADLEAAGFSEVRRWDPRTTEHAEVNDGSQASLSWRGRQVHVSLNMEATKRPV